MEEWESLEWTVVGNGFDTNTVTNDLTFLLESVEIGLNMWGESELSGDENLLSSWELHLCSSEGLTSVGGVLWGNSDGHENLTNGDSCGLAKSLTEGTSHTLLESICSSAGKHLVDTNNVPWMSSDSHVEVFSTDGGHHVLVASNS